MEYSKQEDVIYYAAKEAGISKEQMEFIMKNFWATVRMFLINPLNTKKGILINGFGLFFIRPYTVQKKKDLLKGRNPNSPKIELHEKLLKQLEG